LKGANHEEIPDDCFDVSFSIVPSTFTVLLGLERAGVAGCSQRLAEGSGYRISGERTGARRVPVACAQKEIRDFAAGLPADLRVRCCARLRLP
jgi:hypothetical protein